MTYYAKDASLLTVRLARNGFIVEAQDIPSDRRQEWVFVSERALGQWMEAWAKEAFRLVEK